MHPIKLLATQITEMVVLSKVLPLWTIYFSTLVQVSKCDIITEDMDSNNLKGFCADGEFKRVCIPEDYMKYELPTEERATDVSIGVDIKDIPKVNDRDFSVTLNAYFIAKWHDQRLQVTTRRNLTKRDTRQRKKTVSSGGLFEKDKNVINFESKMSSTTSKV